MTKENLLFLFNRSITGFYLEKDVCFYCKKKCAVKLYGLDDYSRYTLEDIENEVEKPLIETKNIEEVMNFVYKGKTISEWIKPLTELNIDNCF